MVNSVYILVVATLCAATGASAFVGLLAPISNSLGVTLGQAGQLASVFGVAFALTGPITANFVAKYNQKRVLIGALVLTGCLNLLASQVHSFTELIIIRVLDGMCSPLVIALSFACASKLVAAQSRGRALAVVQLGPIFANFAGIPLATLIGNQFGWHAAFAYTGVFAFIAAFVITKFLPDIEGYATAGLKSLLVFFKKPVLGNLLIVLFSQMGIAAVLPYIAPMSGVVGGVHGKWVAVIQSSLAIGMLFGAKLGGKYADKGHSNEFIPFMSLTMAVSLYCVSLMMIFYPLHGLSSTLPFTVAVDMSIFCLLAIMPNVQYRLISYAPESRGTLMALSSAMAFLGRGLGPASGGYVIDFKSVTYLGFGGSMWALIGFSVATIMLAYAPISLLGKPAPENGTPLGKAA